MMLHGKLGTRKLLDRPTLPLPTRCVNLDETQPLKYSY